MGTKYCKEKIVVGLLPETLMLTSHRLQLAMLSNSARPQTGRKDYKI